MKKIVVKVSIHCQICKTDVLKAVTKLQGINSVAVDSEKGTLTIVGDVDPVLVVRRLRKVGRAAEIVSVGPPKPPENKSFIIIDLPSSCNQCELVGYKYVPYDHGSGGCQIL